MKALRERVLRMVIVALAVTSILAIGCGKEKKDSRDKSAVDAEANSEDGSPASEVVSSDDQAPAEPLEGKVVKTPVPDEPKIAEVTREVSGGSGEIQVKSFQLLKSSINSCFSANNFTKVAEDMLVFDQSDPTLPDGRIRFLLPQPGLAAGIDILEFLKKDLGGDESVSRTTIVSDSLSAPYLRALSVVADVIAHACEVDDPYCACADEGDAQAMIARCLPQLNPKAPEFDAVVKGMAAQCKEGAQGQRRAIASLISSYVFAEGR